MFLRSFRQFFSVTSSSQACPKSCSWFTPLVYSPSPDHLLPTEKYQQAWALAGAGAVGIGTSDLVGNGAAAPNDRHFQADRLVH